MQSLFFIVLTASMMIAFNASAEGMARISQLEGKAELMRVAADGWRPLRPNMPLQVGDQLYTRAESFVEITYSTGAVLRMDENTRLTITALSETAVKNVAGLGTVWVNMKKLVAHGKEFEVASPTATAAIRGTAFAMNTGKDSTTSVSVYDGTVAVGPKSSDKAPDSPPASMFEGSHEVPGPQEIPGPYEVSLDEWVSIVAGQCITVRADGKFSQEKFDMKKAAQDDFIKKNEALDKQIEQQEKKGN